MLEFPVLHLPIKWELGLLGDFQQRETDGLMRGSILHHEAFLENSSLIGSQSVPCYSLLQQWQGYIPKTYSAKLTFCLAAQRPEKKKKKAVLLSFPGNFQAARGD